MKCEPHGRGPRAPKFDEERSQEETLHQERCASAEWHGIWRKYLQAQEETRQLGLTQPVEREGISSAGFGISGQSGECR